MKTLHPALRRLRAPVALVARTDISGPAGSGHRFLRLRVSAPAGNP